MKQFTLYFVCPICFISNHWTIKSFKCMIISCCDRTVQNPFTNQEEYSAICMFNTLQTGKVWCM